MAIAIEKRVQNHLPGLGNCMAKWGSRFMNPEELTRWLLIKDQGKQYFIQHGWKLLLEPPLHLIARRYIEGDTFCLFGLYDTFAAMYPEMEEHLEGLGHYDVNLARLVRDMSRQRVVNSQRADYKQGTRDEMTAVPTEFQVLQTRRWNAATLPSLQSQADIREIERLASEAQLSMDMNSQKFDVIVTPSDHLHCGLSALVENLNNQCPPVFPPTLGELMAIARSDLMRTRFPGMWDADGTLDEESCGVHHVAATLEEWGRQHGANLQLGIVVGGQDSPRIIKNEQQENVSTIWIRTDNDSERPHYSTKVWAQRETDSTLEKNNSAEDEGLIDQRLEDMALPPSVDGDSDPAEVSILPDAGEPLSDVTVNERFDDIYNAH